MKIKIFTLFLLLYSGMSVAQATPAASTVMNKAMEQAKAENKKVFLMFDASWCSWCKRMEKNMEADATKDLFNKNYVVAHLTVQERGDKKSLENPGADALVSKYGGDKQGLPYWVVLDAKGKMLENSLNEKGENLGCPASPEEVDLFLGKLKRTSKLSDKQLAVIREAFVLKK